jgi:hypothetical protein
LSHDVGHKICKVCDIDNFQDGVAVSRFRHHCAVEAEFRRLLDAGGTLRHRADGAG